MSKFFEPTEEFIEWLIKYANGRPIADVGAGECQLADAIVAKNYPCVAIEPFGHIFYDDLENTRYNYLVPSFAHECKMLKETQMLLVCARPSHDGWVEEIPSYMNEASELLYIGLKKNIDVDFYDIQNMYSKFIDAPATDSHEVVISFDPETSVVY